MSRPLSYYQARYDAMEPGECDEDACDLGMVPCDRCGRTGVDPLHPRDMWESDECRDCSGDGMVLCPGCGECGRGEALEVMTYGDDDDIRF